MSAVNETVKAWFAKAENDLRAVERLNSDADEDLITGVMCYLAQQCAEKYFKGYLVAQKTPFKFVHQLAYLVRLCMEVDPEFTELLDIASNLQGYATGVRYPPREDPSPNDAREAPAQAKAIRDFVLTKLKV